jgi:hypothetical protein
MVAPLIASVAAALRTPPVNVLRLSLHPDGLAPMIVNLAAWRAHVLQRLARQVEASGDAALAALRDELQALPAPASAGASTDPDADGAAGRDRGAGADEHADAGPAAIVPLVLQTPLGRLSFVTTVTVFGAPSEVTLAELAVETLLPADADTAARLRRLHAGLG